MTGRLAGKVALISGGARGQGAAAGWLFASEGAKVVLGDVLDSQGQEVAGRICAGGWTAMYVHLDVRKEADWANAVDAAITNYGSLTILLNNAGILRMEGIEETSLQLWNEVISVNQTGTFLGIKHAIPAMRAAGGGSIINVSSILGLVGFPGCSAYQSTKGAIRLLTKSAAVQYAKENIRVNSIHPGSISTPMVTEGVSLEVRKMVEQVTPISREGTAEEIAFGTLFLASDESSYMTGSELVIDGGYTAQ